MSSCWPNCFAASAMALGLGADRLGSVETEQLATFVSSFYDSVQYEGEAVVWIELECGVAVAASGVCREAGRIQHLLFAHPGRAGYLAVGEGHVAVGADKRGSAGTKPAIWPWRTRLR